MLVFGGRFIVDQIIEGTWKELEIIRVKYEWQNPKYDKKSLFWPIKAPRRKKTGNLRRRFTNIG